MTRAMRDGLVHRLAELKNLYIPHPHAERALAALEKAHADSRGGTSAEFVIVYGAPDSGKSVAALAHLARHPTHKRRRAGFRPVAHAIITGGRPTHRSVAHDILRAFGTTIVHGRTTSFELVERFKVAAEAQETALCIVDEAQQLFSSYRDDGRQAAAEWLKTLLNESPCAFAFIGSDPLLSGLDHNESFARRITEMVTLDPYSWSAAKDRAAYRSFLASYDALLHPLRCSGLEAVELASRLHLASGGKVGATAKLLRKAYRLAVIEGADQIRAEHLAHAFDHFDARPAYQNRNPFLPPGLRQLDTPLSVQRTTLKGRARRTTIKQEFRTR